MGTSLKICLPRRNLGPQTSSSLYDLVQPFSKLVNSNWLDVWLSKMFCSQSCVLLKEKIVGLQTHANSMNQPCRFSRLTIESTSLLHRQWGNLIRSTSMALKYWYWKAPWRISFKLNWTILFLSPNNAFMDWMALCCTPYTKTVYSFGEKRLTKVI